MIPIADLMQVRHPGYRVFLEGREISRDQYPLFLSYCLSVDKKFRYYAMEHNGSTFTDDSLMRIAMLMRSLDETDEPELTMGRYRWQSPEYLLDVDDLDLEDATRQISMTGLLRSSLLKRLESSVYALAQTCGRMAESCEGFLDLLNNGFIANSDILGQWMADDIEEEDMERIQ